MSNTTPQLKWLSKTAIEKLFKQYPDFKKHLYEEWDWFDGILEDGDEYRGLMLSVINPRDGFSNEGWVCIIKARWTEFYPGESWAGDSAWGLTDYETGFAYPPDGDNSMEIGTFKCLRDLHKALPAIFDVDKITGVPPNIVRRELGK